MPQDLKLTRTSYRNLYHSPVTGLYYVRKMVNGRSRTLSTGEGSLGRAERRMHEIITRLNDKKAGWDPKEVPSLREWWKDYRQAKKKSARTWHREEEIMDLHILPILGRYELDQITQNMVERHLNKRRREGAAEGTVTREQSLLHAVFQAAVDDDLLMRNPMRKIPRTPYATRQRVVSLEDQDKLQVVLSPMMERWFLFMLGTGIRLDECRGIKPSRDVNFEERQFRVSGKGHNAEPKERWVPFLDAEIDLIVKEQISENNTPKVLHRMNRFDTLWAQEQSFFRKELTRACKVANVPYFSPHTLRHTFATRYLRGGGDIFVLSQILGHSSVDITQKVYAHLLTKDHAKLSEHVQLGIGRKGKIVAFPAVS